jgi:hypothetical protein
MDDESYFNLEGNEWQQKSYYESVEHNAPESVKVFKKYKFPGTVLVWLAISEKGMSDRLFINSGLAVNKNYHQKGRVVLTTLGDRTLCQSYFDQFAKKTNLICAKRVQPALADIKILGYVEKENVPQ